MNSNILIEIADWFSQHWPTQQRHDTSLALAGGLLRSDWSVQQTVTFIETVATKAGDEEAHKRVTNVHSTANKLKEKKPVWGWPKLSELIGPAVVRELRIRLGLVVTLEQLALSKHIPVDFLQTLDIHELPFGGVGIPYKDVSGRICVVKERTALSAKSGSKWPFGKALMAYGEDRVDEIARNGYVILCEGESDSWTLWYHGFPTLGLPGAGTVKNTLHLGHVANLNKIYVIQEPDDSGQDFVDSIRQRIGDLGKGRINTVHVITLSPHKDPNELHCHNPNGFKVEFEKAMENAKHLSILPPKSFAGDHLWPDIVTIPELSAVEPFPVDVFPVQVQRLLWELEQAMPSIPIDFGCMAVLSNVSVGIGRSRLIELKNTETQSAMLYAAAIGAPGIGKTHPNELLNKPTKDIFHEGHVAWKADRDEWVLMEKKERVPKPVFENRNLIGDATRESVAQILGQAQRGVGLLKNELSGFFSGLNQYKSGQGDDRQFFLQLWDGTFDPVDRRSQSDLHGGPIYARSGFCTIAGTIQPDLIYMFRSEGLKRNGKVDDGFEDRILVVMPDPKPIVGDTEFEMGQDVLDDWDTIVRKLYDLEMLTPSEFENAHPRPKHIPLRPTAKNAWMKFTHDLAEQRNQMLQDQSPLAGSWAKLRSYAARLALILHYLRWACGEADDNGIDEVDIQNAVKLIEYFKSHIVRVRQQAATSQHTPEAKKILAWIFRHVKTKFTYRELQQGLKSKSFRAEDVISGLDYLESHGYIRQFPDGKHKRPGKVARAYEVHPDLHTVSFPYVPQSPQHKSDVDASNLQGGDCIDAEVEKSFPQSSPDSTEWGKPDPALTEPVPPIQQMGGNTGESVGDAKHLLNNELETLRGNGGNGGTLQVASDSSQKKSFVLVNDSAKLPGIITAVGESASVGLDIETTGLDPRRDRIRLLSLHTECGTWLIDCFQVDPNPLFELLAEKTIIGHNLVFDLQFLMHLGFQPGQVSDTMLMSRMLHGTRTVSGFHSLTQCVERELGQQLGKEEQTSDWSRPDLTPEQLRYAASDVVCLPALRDSLAKQIRDTGQVQTATLEMRCLPAIALMSFHGVSFDVTTWKALAKEAEAEATRLVDEMDKLAPSGPNSDMFGQTVNWSSPKQVVRVFHALGINIESVGDEVLANIDHPLSELLRQHRHSIKRANTYGTDWLKHVAADGRVYAGWQQIGADSGRMACKKPNLQNLPRDPRYRQCFVAPEGRVLVVADYSQIELRIAAKYANERKMIAAYERGEDLHTRTAKMLLGKDDVTKADRQLAKSANFGLLYGMGAKGYRAYAKNNYGVNMTLEQATAYRKAFFDAYPALRRWHREIGRTNDSAIETRTLKGRRRADVSRFTEKLNTPVQGTGADGLKLAMALLWDRRQEVPGAFPILAIHDEIVVECDEEQAEEVKNWLETAMKDGMQPLIDPVPVEVEAVISHDWEK